MAAPNTRKTKNVFLKNRKATFEYAIEDSLTAGMVLVGSEIKSIRAGRVSFADSFCFFHEGELWVKNLHIAEYENAGYAGHDPVRERKLLLNRKELKKWQQKIKEKGYSIVPLSIFISERGYAKLHVGLGKGKKLYDKRDTIKNREASRQLREKDF